jgi:hypothetical protein
MQRTVQSTKGLSKPLLLFIRGLKKKFTPEMRRSLISRQLRCSVVPNRQITLSFAFQVNNWWCQMYVSL